MQNNTPQGAPFDEHHLYTRSQLIQFGEEVKKACAEKITMEVTPKNLQRNILSIDVTKLIK